MVIGLFSFFDGMRDAPLVAGVNAAASERRAHAVTLAAIDVPYRREASGEAGRGKRWFHERLSARSVEHVFSLGRDAFDAAIFAFPEAGLMPYAADLWRKGTPVIMIGREAGEIPRVLNNNVAAMRHAVAQLARRGHRRIAFISGPADNLCSIKRLQGYREGVREHGLDSDPALVLAGDFTPPAAREQIRVLLARDRSFTAVLAGNDWSAFAVLEELEHAGRRVPEDVEVIGFDNVSACRWSTPTLSTYDGQLYQLGQVAVDALFQQANGGGTSAETIVDPIYVPRRSTRESETGIVATQLLSDEWMANRFAAEQALGRLRRGAHEEALIDTLTHPATQRPAYVAAVRALQDEVLRRGLNPICLFPLVNGAASGARFDGVGLAMLADVVLLETMRLADTAPRFSAAAIGLRELPVSEATVDAAVAAIHEVFRRLDIQRAGLLVRPAQAATADTGAWYWWSREDAAWVETMHRAPAGSDLRRLTGSDEPSNWFAVPLIFGEENMGLLVIDGATEFRLHVPELARLITATLHSTRLAAALRESEYFYHSLVESLPQTIVRKDAGGRITYANTAYAERWGRSLEQVLGRTEAEFLTPEAAAALRADDERVMSTGQTIERESVDEAGGGRRFWYVKNVPLQDGQRRPIGVQVLSWDVTPLRQTEEQLRKAQSELLEASRLAGIAEIAAGLLHNVGNMLNNVNTSAAVIRGRLQGLKLGGVAKVAQLLTEQGERLPQFFTSDPRRAQLPAYLGSLHAHLESEQRSSLGELDHLRQSIEQINRFVAAQQAYDRADPVVESVAPAQLLEHALTMCSALCERHGVAVVREFSSAADVRVQRSKALQILVQLIRNAIEATQGNATGNRIVTLTLAPNGEGLVQLIVCDNGVGIAAGNLTRVFQNGYSTKSAGRGFALHNSALAASEMGGSLRAESGGEGQGARFVLTLPT